MVHLHSSLSLEQSAGWTYQSNRSSLTLRCDSQTLRTALYKDGSIQKQWSDPLAALDWMSKNRGESAVSRWAGYLSYDLGRLFESIPVIACDDLQLPLFCFSLYKSESVLPVTDSAAPTSPPPPITTLSRQSYLQVVSRAIDYIRAGDIFQVNLSQRYTADLLLPPHQVWQNLLAQSPAAYGAYLDFDDHVIVSNSPELFLQVSPDGAVITRPIKGTRPLGPGMFDQLRDSEKDQAELNMIVDLQRNDLGRICQTGSVKVTQPRTIETHPTLYHGVATVAGLLRPGTSFVDILKSTFPGGSITGAPKIRAMQIIEELEPVRRGPYCGAIGYLASDGSMQFNIAIRTMVATTRQTQNKIHIAVGGGIVADSDPATEYQETLVKAAAMFRSLHIL